MVCGPVVSTEKRWPRTLNPPNYAAPYCFVFTVSAQKTRWHFSILFSVYIATVNLIVQLITSSSGPKILRTGSTVYANFPIPNSNYDCTAFSGTLHKRKELYEVNVLPSIQTTWALSSAFLAASVTCFGKFAPWNTTASASLSSPQFKHLGTRNRSTCFCGTSALPSGLVIRPLPATSLSNNLNCFWNASRDSLAPQAPQVMCAKVTFSQMRFFGATPTCCNKSSTFFVIRELNWSGRHRCKPSRA